MSSRSCETWIVAAFPVARMLSPETILGRLSAIRRKVTVAFSPDATAIWSPHGRFFNLITRDWGRTFTIERLNSQEACTGGKKPFRRRWTIGGEASAILALKGEGVRVELHSRSHHAVPPMLGSWQQANDSTCASRGWNKGWPAKAEEGRARHTDSHYANDAHLR
ncbi:hypothetical protein L209DRAFT_205950 [Thermothelomyces heterothallicus CBS 203.75]